jgi:hypothetical protein
LIGGHIRCQLATITESQMTRPCIFFCGVASAISLAQLLVFFSSVNPVGLITYSNQPNTNGREL